jgi:hypothetical protein
MRSTTTYVTVGLAALFILFAAPNSHANERYGGGCDSCHGDFTGGVSPKGSTFPGDDKHQMHRSNSEMDSDCSLCHTSVGDNPFIGSSAGTANNPGLGCVGCHGRAADAGNDSISAGYGAGLRQHHDNAGVGSCRLCHSDANPNNYTPVGEDWEAPYYGVAADSNVANACNLVASARTNENWTVGDFTGLDNDGDLIYDAADPDCAPPTPTPGDINFDGAADIVWRNTVTGQNWAYLMAGSTIDQSFEINTVSNQAWQIVGIGDFDGDNDADLLWRNSSTGQNWVYLMQDGNISSSESVNTVADQAWQVAGVGDFDGDDDDDILWRNSSNGQNWMYLMSGSSITSSVAVNTVSTDWVVEGTGDYNGDTRADILWRHGGTGQVWMYLMNGESITSSLPVASVLQQWQIVGNGDYDGDGNSDVMWRRVSNGQNWVWLMNGASISTSELVNTVAGSNWQVKGNGDYDGDGNSDILWRNGMTGQNWVYLMDGSTILSSEGINFVTDSAWEIFFAQ